MYLFKVEFWDEYEHKVNNEEGIVDGVAYRNAIEHIVKYYGQKNLSSITLKPLDDILPKDQLTSLG